MVNQVAIIAIAGIPLVAGSLAVAVVLVVLRVRTIRRIARVAAAHPGARVVDCVRTQELSEVLRAHPEEFAWDADLASIPVSLALVVDSSSVGIWSVGAVSGLIASVDRAQLGRFVAREVYGSRAAYDGLVVQARVDGAVVDLPFIAIGRGILGALALHRPAIRKLCAELNAH